MTETSPVESSPDDTGHLSEPMTDQIGSEGHQLFTAKDYQFRPLLEGVSIGAVMFLVISATTYFIYFHSLNALKAEISDGIRRTAMTVSKFMDGDLHSTFVNKEQENSEAYARALVPLQNAKDADPAIGYIYTLVLIDRQVHFILDPTEAGIFDKNGQETKSHIMDVYDTPTDEMLYALRTGECAVESELTQDDWGWFITGYAPVFNNACRKPIKNQACQVDDAEETCEVVAVLGVDISAKEYLSRLEPIRRATVRTIMTGFFISFLIGALVWFMRNFSKVINKKRLLILHLLNSKKH